MWHSYVTAGLEIMTLLNSTARQIVNPAFNATLHQQLRHGVFKVDDTLGIMFEA